MLRNVVICSAGMILATTLGTAVAGPPGDKGKPDHAVPADSVDGWFGELERVVPGGFGGMFMDEKGDLNVYLLNPGEAGKAKKALEPVLQARQASRGKAPEDRGKPDDPQAQAERARGGEIRVLQGQYAFSELVDWHAGMRPVLKVDGVVFTDVDEASNRLVVGVEDPAALDQVEQQLAESGVPLDAVIFEEAEPVLPMHTLRDRVRPVQGGLQINFPGFLCTLGFNAQRYGLQGFITNSHCTTTQGGVEYTPYYQPSISGSNYIGYEIADPAYFTGGACPSGRRCRWSDSAFAYLTTSSSLGRIARTTSWTGSINVSHSSPSFQIVNEVAWPVVGDYLDKVGRTTGWTYGRVVSTCQNTNVNGTNITLLCQDRVRSVNGSQIVNSGDSGSPVFVWRGSIVDLSGVLWGGNSSGTEFVFSAMSNIEYELGALTTF